MFKLILILHTPNYIARYHGITWLTGANCFPIFIFCPQNQAKLYLDRESGISFAKCEGFLYQYGNRITFQYHNNCWSLLHPQASIWWTAFTLILTEMHFTVNMPWEQTAVTGCTTKSLPPINIEQPTQNTVVSELMNFIHVWYMHQHHFLR